MTVPVPAVTQFVVLASRTVSFGDRGQVTGGHLGVAASANATPTSLTAGTDGRIGVGQVLLAQTVTLRDRTVAGEIGANVINAPNATTGPRSAFVAPPAVPVPAAVTAGTVAVTVNSGQTTSLAAGRFGAVTVNGTLNLAGGTYDLQSLRLGVDARVTALARSTVRIATGLAAADRARILPAAPLRAGDLQLIVAGTIDANNNSLLWSSDGQLTAIVVARNAFRAGDRLIAVGAIAAQDVITGGDTRLTFDTGFGCSTDAACNDGNACTTDTCVAAQCTHTAAANGTACSDANACTQTDVCQAGVCVGGNPVVCVASDQCHDPGVCSPATGVCSNPARQNGTACNDANACTQADACQGGVCVGGSPVVCVASDQCHDPGVCSPATGVCSNPARQNGTACTDGNACTQADACQGGVCVGGSPVVCAAADQCHVAGVCSPATGACSVGAARVDGTACSDSNACTRTDVCQAGVCVGGNAVACAAADQCHNPGACDPATGVCSNPARPNGTACTDGNACTLADACQGGLCVGSTPVVCAAADQCHVAGVCSPATGTCSNPASADGIACDNGSVCSASDTCQAGVCTDGPSDVITEIASGLAQPTAMVPGPDGNLWFISPETSAGATDGSVARFDPVTGLVTPFFAGKLLLDIAQAADGNLWLAEVLSATSGLPALGRITTAGQFLPDFIGIPAQALGGLSADGNVWFVSGSGGVDVVGSLLPSDSTVLTLSFTASAGRAVTAGPDGNTWIVESNAGSGGLALVGRITPAGTLSEFAIDSPGDLNDITTGSDGNLWFTDAGRNEIGRITPAGAVTKYAIPTAASGPYGIAPGPDGNLWFTERSANRIARITPAGSVSELACIPTANSAPWSVAAGRDGNVWFTESRSGNLGAVRLGRLRN